MTPAARAVTAATAVTTLGALTAAANRIATPRLRPGPHRIDEPVTVCVPARDEAERLPALLADLRAQRGLPGLRVLVLDDASTDGTSDAARAAIADDPRFRLSRSDIHPERGWTGKTAACARLAELADTVPHPAAAEPETTTRAPGSVPGEHGPGATGVLVFLDADVRLAPDAVAAAVAELRRSRAALVCPWPSQRAGSPAEHLVQPLLCWSWASTLPVAVANRSTRPSMAVACGQFLVFDAAAYRAIGGHAAVADSVTEDLAIARALRQADHRTVLVAAGPLAETRMYRGASELAEGYTRWLWSAYGGAAGSVAVGSIAALAFWLPPLAAIFGRGQVRRTGLAGYAAAVAARLLARSLETGGPVGCTDTVAAALHPLSVAAYLALSAASHSARRTGGLRWKGRAIHSGHRPQPTGSGVLSPIDASRTPPG